MAYTITDYNGITYTDDIRYDIDDAINDKIVTMKACKANSINWLNKLIYHGVDVNSNFKALLHVCKKGYTNILNILINNDINLNILDKYNNSALSTSCYYSQYDIVNTLLQTNKITVLEQQNELGFTPLLEACVNSNLSIVNLLLLYNASYFTINNDEDNCIILSCYNNKFEITKRMLETSLDINYQNKDLKTALHIACQYGSIDCIKILLENGIDTTIPDNNNKLAIDYCEDKTLFINY